MFALDHSHYFRWLRVLINDMKQLPVKHPAIYQDFGRGHLTAKISCRKFSGLSEDQAQKQNNKLVKIDGGAIRILDNRVSIMKLMVACPKISCLLRLFETERGKIVESILAPVVATKSAKILEIMT